jgi:hypothetical protein
MLSSRPPRVRRGPHVDRAGQQPIKVAEHDMELLPVWLLQQQQVGAHRAEHRVVKLGVEDRYGRGATLITSQILVDRWQI